MSVYGDIIDKSFTVNGDATKIAFQYKDNNTILVTQTPVGDGPSQSTLCTFKETLGASIGWITPSNLKLWSKDDQYPIDPYTWMVVKAPVNYILWTADNLGNLTHSDMVFQQSIKGKKI